MILTIVSIIIFIQLCIIIKLFKKHAETVVILMEYLTATKASLDRIKLELKRLKITDITSKGNAESEE